MSDSAPRWAELAAPDRTQGLPSSAQRGADRKSTRLNSSHRCISYAVFCLKKKKTHLLLGGVVERLDPELAQLDQPRTAAQHPQLDHRPPLSLRHAPAALAGSRAKPPPYGV